MYCRELEKQRQLEWEGQKLQEMELERQKEQDRLLKLKGHNQTLSIELETLSTKVKELSQKICDTRVAVTNVKSTIDGMRTTRDTLMSDQTQCKTKIKEQNAKLVQLSQEKAKLDAKAKTGVSGDEQAYITNKQVFNSLLSIGLFFNRLNFLDSHKAIEGQDRRHQS